jgi:IS5 family transposase
MDRFAAGGFTMKQIGFDDESRALHRISELGDRLEWLNKAIDWSIFVPLLIKAKPDRTQSGKGGRPPLSPLMMFKILILQELHGVANDATEFLINDRLSWKRFLGLSLAEKAPDSTSIWQFREDLRKSGVYEELFHLFNSKMVELGVITHRGSIVDASFVDVPRQRNSRETNRAIKEGVFPEAWHNANANMLCQKDIDASWAMKNKETHFGYKVHVVCDADSKMIVDSRVSTASVHDSQVLPSLLTRCGNFIMRLWGDSAYVGEDLHDQITVMYPGISLQICERGTRSHPLTEVQKEHNREKSRVRSRVEHVFGYMTGSMGGMNLRSIGKERACCTVVLRNLTYNLSRYATLLRLGRAPAMS